MKKNKAKKQTKKREEKLEEEIKLHTRISTSVKDRDSTNNMNPPCVNLYMFIKYTF